MKTILVTGGAGFIGSNLVRHFIARTDFAVVAVDKLTYAGNKRNLDGITGPRLLFVEADIADQTAMKSIFGDHRPFAVFNLAAETHVDRSIDGPHAFVNTNIMGAFVLLEAARKFFAQLGEADQREFRFVQVSTDEVYGSLGKTGFFTENTTYDPSSPYSASKAAADHLTRAYFSTYGLPTMITNCSNNFGPYQFPEKLVPLTILNAMEGKPLPIYGDGGNVRDWLFVEDHCAALHRVLEKGEPGEKYNIGASNERTNVQMVDTICAALEKVLPARENSALAKAPLQDYKALKTFVPDRPGHDRRYAIDAKKFHRKTGWKPEHNFDHAMKATVEWYVRNRPWCEAVQSGKYHRERLGLGN